MSSSSCNVTFLVVWMAEVTSSRSITVTSHSTRGNSTDLTENQFFSLYKWFSFDQHNITELKALGLNHWYYTLIIVSQTAVLHVSWRAAANTSFPPAARRTFRRSGQDSDAYAFSVKRDGRRQSPRSVCAFIVLSKRFLLACSWVKVM